MRVRNHIFTGFIAIMGIVAIFFIYQAIGSFITYRQLNERICAHIESIDIVEKKKKYQVHIHYCFFHGDQKFEKEGEIGPSYPNRLAAIAKKDRISINPLFIWISNKNPQKAALENSFPYKKCFSAMVMLGLTLYFLALSLYLRRKGEKTWKRR